MLLLVSTESGSAWLCEMLCVWPVGGTSESFLPSVGELFCINFPREHCTENLVSGSPQGEFVSAIKDTPRL